MELGAIHSRSTVLFRMQSGEMGAAGDGVYLVGYDALLYKLLQLLSVTFQLKGQYCSSFKGNTNIVCI